ncbi:MAG: hypothetical protein ACRCW2_02315 [Cellulosilyticaceae bacterium]
MKKINILKASVTFITCILSIFLLKGYGYTTRMQTGTITYVFEGIPEFLLTLSLCSLMCVFIINTRGKLRGIGMLIISVVISISFLTAASKTQNYVQVSSPNGTHQVLIADQLQGFDIWRTTIYEQTNRYRKKVIDAIVEEKNGVIASDEATKYEWLNEDLLLITYQDYGKTKKSLINFLDCNVEGTEE